ncbi:MAG: response regulator transcription factor [Pseudomonadota bacterium]
MSAQHSAKGTAPSNAAINAAPLDDNAPHVLLVDDDQRILDLLTRFLSDHGFRVTPANQAAAARSAMRGLAFDLMILDVNMPGESGLSLARDLKQTQIDLPILMLTARDDTNDRIAGLESGVDDYLTKPFEPRELLLRLQNIIRRGQPTTPVCSDDIKMGDLTFHISRGELRRGDKTLKLTERERDLLRHFCQKPGTTVARHELAKGEVTGSERAIDVQINRLRRKIETDPSNPVYLQTVRGKGYILYTD